MCYINVAYDKKKRVSEMLNLKFEFLSEKCYVCVKCLLKCYRESLLHIGRKNKKNFVYFKQQW